jgi:lysyl-tRNA synthetase, class II
MASVVRPALRGALRVAGVATAALAEFVVMLAATGWLYLLHAGPERFGPRLGDALPLDELSGHAAAPVALFLLVWGCAAALLGLIARFVGAERVTAALVLALAVGVWNYLQTGVSILAVRQVAAEDAFRAAAGLHAVYVPAALAGLAGALLGSTRRRRLPRAPLVVAWFVAVAGLLAIVDAILPSYSDTLIGSLAPGAQTVAQSLEGPLGAALLAVAPRLARRRRRAWQLALVLLAGSAVLHGLHSDYSAVPVALLALALLSCRHAFDAPGDPTARPRALARAGLTAAAVYGYGAAALWANRVAADRPFTLRFAARETTRPLLGLAVGGSPRLSGGFSHWFGPSVLVLALAGAAWALHSWLAPWRFRLRQEGRARELTRALVHEWGSDTLAPFVLRADKSYFFARDERALLAYRVVGGVAVVSGDPIGAPDAFTQLLDDFLEFARERDWRVAVLGASEPSLPLYRDRGLRALYHGDEAVLEVDRFSLEGRRIRKVRQSVNRLSDAGFRAVSLHTGAIGPELRAELEEIAARWRGSEPDRGFVMELDALFRLDGDDALFVIGVGPDGRPKGFLHFAVVPASRALSLSSMPRLRETPNGFNEWLVCEAVRWSRAHGFRYISLNFAPFAALLAPDAQLSPVQKVQRGALLALKGHFQLDNLLLFNRKFFPSWQRRFVVYEHVRDLPRVAIAALAAEAYIPFPGRSQQ